MLKYKTFLRKKSVLYTAFSAVSALFLLALSLSYSYSVSAAAPSGGFGVGSNQGRETGINLDAFNRVRTDVNAGVYDRPCQPDEEDPNKWHSLVNVEKKCHYNHQHNDDPNYVNDIFGTPGAWFGSPGMEISYPWQTFKATTATEPNTTYMANHQMENDLKHEGYVWVVRRDQPCTQANCIKDFRVQVHAVMGAGDMPVRFHSFSLEARVCANGSNLATCGIIRIGGWMDMGQLATRAPGDLDCGAVSRLQVVPLPADTLYFPLERPQAPDEFRCQPTINALPAYPSSTALAQWWGKFGAGTRLQLSAYDPIGNVDRNDPAHWQFYCAQTDMNCHYDASMFSLFVGYVLKVPGDIRNGAGQIAPMDANHDGRSDFKGYETRLGSLNPTCSTAGLDCIPVQYDNVVLNEFNNTEASYAAQNPCLANCKPVDYDISPPGKRWITWFYRYAPGGAVPTPVPTTPIPTTPTSPVPSSPTPVTPTPKPPTDPSLVVNVNPANANVNTTISVDLALWNVQNIYGMQTTCKVDPKVLAGATRGDGDIFNSTNSFFVDKGFKADGSWVVGASRLQPNPVFAGNGIAFKLSFTVKAAGASTVNCTVLGVDANGKEVALKVVNGSFNGAAAATSQPTAQPTAQPTVQSTVPQVTAEPTSVPTSAAITATTVTTNASITGKMLYQNYPDNSNITVQLVTDKGAVIATVTTSADGSYSFKNVPVGTVGVTAIGNLYLRIGKVVTITAGQAVDLGTLTLPGGDTDNSGDISVTDASLIGANFDNSVNPAPASADVNGDGVINIRDLAIIGGNFGLKSPIIIK